MGRPSRDLFEIAENLLKLSIVNGECTDYHLSTDSGGYGQTYYGSAHRVVWTGIFGPTKGKWVLHTCDNRKCINPEHLFLGDCQANVDDMISKGRRVDGKQIRAISDKQMIELKALREQGMTPTQLARHFNVGTTTIKRNLNGLYDGR